MSSSAWSLPLADARRVSGKFLGSRKRPAQRHLDTLHPILSARLIRETHHAGSKSCHAVLTLVVMRVAAAVPPESLDAAVGIMNLQEAVMSLADNSVEDVARRLCESSLVTTSDGVKQIVHNLFVGCRRRRPIVKKVVDLIVELLSYADRFEALRGLKDELAVLDVLQDRWYRLFMVHLIARRIITPEDFSSWIHRMAAGEGLFTVFCWYAPYLEKFVRDDFDNLLRIIRGRIERGDPSVPAEVAAYIQKFQSMRAANWALHNKMFSSSYPVGSIAACIRQDSVESLSLSICRVDTKNKADEFEKFAVDMRIEPTVFESAEILRHSPTLLQFAAFHQAPKCFSYLLSLGADVNAKDDAGLSVVQFAVAGGLKSILSICVTQKMDFSGAAYTAIMYHQFHVFEYLFQEGLLTIDESTPEYPSVVHCAAMFDNMRVLLYSLDEGVDVNLPDVHGAGPLHYAARYESINACLLLVNAYNIDVNLQDELGRTPLHFAVKAQKLESVRVLINHPNLDPNIPDEKGATPLAIAAKKGARDIVVTLLRHHANVNTRTDVGLSPLHLAAARNHLDVVETLLHSPDIDINIGDLVCF